MYTNDDAAKDAGSTKGEALWRAIKTQFPQALANASCNRNLNDDQAYFISQSKKTPAEVLGFLAGDVRFKKNYKITLALCKNPKTPQRVVLTLLKHIKLFDLADLTRNHFVPTVTRQKVQWMLIERLPGMPSGVKVALSRRVSVELLMRLMEKSDRRVVDTCLTSPILTEQHLFRVVQRPVTKQHVIQAIAGHGKWSLRYTLKYALVRNVYTPMAAVEKFIEDLKSKDLRDLYADTKVPPSTKPFIHRELLRRDEGVEVEEDVVHELEGHEDMAFMDEEFSGLIEKTSSFIEFGPEDEPEEGPDEVEKEEDEGDEGDEGDEDESFDNEPGDC
jgi:hypothetical protein